MIPAMQKLLAVLSYGDIDVESSRRLADLKQLDPLKIFYRTIDYKVYNKEVQVPTRIYLPDKEEVEDAPALLFFHGGGWVTESVDTYNRVCARMAQETKHVVISVDYRLAPEYRFPIGLEDCYTVAKAVYTDRFFLNLDPKRITLIGDSAGGNLASVVSLMARDKGEFTVPRQILIYPATNNDYSEHSPFLSVKENGTDYLLTAKKMQDYLDLYERDKSDRQNPYFAPLLEKDLSNQPDTLVITAEHDPLRDEGEAYGQRLKEAGNQVEMHRIAGALHGYFALGIQSPHVRESFQYINQFLSEK